ncbi:glutamate 5-kinase [Methanimicrococcus blatticola]|uniref:Glutamate 5-kinase n=1 Tax=Methanimicrococcus blatticola TaxID=91560 RepID=A0A484F2P5_9EURY|nr:glutamate 5-kinase [Methanimicrococcus blatticola]MBZ3935324.1 glutamate 5-kinase [Methanimicrococcus blatticola]MCC2508578.1 glutamate 5-kinase [Methanimicrococcus blatticola]TDQ67885.1 glutamate 5-kinase [Methanimicrococcus blatticola]
MQKSKGQSREDLFQNVSRVVIKIGTTSIMKEESSVDTAFLDRVAAQTAALLKDGKEVILVTSGAIGVGLNLLGIPTKPREIPIRQAAAAVGQGELMRYWSEAFQKHDIKTAQILLSYDFYSDRVKYLNLRNSIGALLGYGVVPIINENDSTCTNEIDTVFGDNDRLSAMVASKIEADLLIILSDIDGLYDKNPKLHDDAELIPFVEKITPEIEKYGGDPTSTKGVGGMRTKIIAAKIAEKSGCHMIIANSQIENVITRLVAGEEIGTLFYAEAEEASNNKIRWVLLSKSSGTITVDRGAMNALMTTSGLLPKGIVAVSGDFERGDIVDIECGGAAFAKGITDYDAEEIQKIKGVHTDDIEKILGHKDYDNVIRKENLALLD